MQKSFSRLTLLDISVVDDDVVPVLPDSFLGGSAPHLRELILANIPFPSIPKLLLSASGLVKLTLENIPDSGYFSPSTMATALTVMTKLETLHLVFNDPRSLPDPASRPPPPPPRFVLPALTDLMFRGVYAYLEDLLARIDAPLLDYLRVIFFMDLNFDVPQLHWLIGHAEEFKAFDHAQVWILDDSVMLGLSSETRADKYPLPLELQIISRALDWQFSSLAQIGSSSFPLLSTLEDLQIWEDDKLPSSHWTDDMENAQWLELLDSFTALKNLYLMDNVARHVCRALLELSRERVT